MPGANQIIGSLRMGRRGRGGRASQRPEPGAGSAGPRRRAAAPLDCPPYGQFRQHVDALHGPDQSAAKQGSEPGLFVRWSE